MWTYKTKIVFICYKLFASWLPISQRSSFAKKWRTFFAKRIIKQCGENVNIERGAVFTPDLSIGSNSGIGINCEVYGSVTIGNDVWIGRRVMIMPGVSIGNGCVIGAGAVVTHNVPDYCVAAGVPAKIVKERG